MKNIKPDIDLQNSIECSRITESREYYKGKSFNFANEWHSGINYFNDNYVTDFVSYKGTLLALGDLIKLSSNIAYCKLGIVLRLPFRVIMVSIL